MGGLPGSTVVKNLPANARDAEDLGLIPGSGRSPEGGNGNLLAAIYSIIAARISRTEELIGYSP